MGENISIPKMAYPALEGQLTCLDPIPEETTVHLNPMSGEDSDLDPGQERILYAFIL
jgi:hypothetical protein